MCLQCRRLTRQLYDCELTNVLYLDTIFKSTCNLEGLDVVQGTGLVDLRRAQAQAVQSQRPRAGWLTSRPSLRMWRRNFFTPEAAASWRTLHRGTPVNTVVQLGGRQAGTVVHMGLHIAIGPQSHLTVDYQNGRIGTAPIRAWVAGMWCHQVQSTGRVSRHTVNQPVESHLHRPRSDTLHRYTLCARSIRCE